MGRTWTALELSQREWDIVEDARRDAEKHAGQSFTNKEFLLLMANDTSAKWRKK